MRREELTMKERNEMQSLLLGTAHGAITAILCCDESQWHMKLIQLQKRLSEGIEIIY